MPPAHVVLVFDGTQLEVDQALVTRRGCLRALARQAEDSLGLCPGKYSFFSTQGKVDSQSALHSAMQAAEDGTCTLEIHEHPEGKVLREVHSAMQDLEARMLAKMEDALTEMRKELEPKMHTVADEQLSLRSKICQLTEEAFSSRADMFTSGAELGARLDALERDCLAMRIDNIEWEKELRGQVDDIMVSTAVMEAEVSMQAATTIADELRTLEARECELRQEMALQDVCKIESSAKDGVQSSHVAVRGLEQKPRTSKALKSESAPSLAGIRSLQPSAPFAPIPYSTKGIDIPSGTPLYNSNSLRSSAEHWSVGVGTEAFAPFAQFGSSRPRLCRSSPLLPPLN